MKVVSIRLSQTTRSRDSLSRKVGDFLLQQRRTCLRRLSDRHKYWHSWLPTTEAPSQQRGGAHKENRKKTRVGVVLQDCELHPARVLPQLPLCKLLSALYKKATAMAHHFCQQSRYSPDANHQLYI